jgi:prepilin-type N-terminal cleavage/methylation domain-containing protein
MIPPNKKNSRQAFTLVELLVVISIISVLAAFTVVSVGTISKNRKISTARGELNQIISALENYKAKYGTYPPGNNGSYTAPVVGAMLNQLYYELSGTTQNGVNFTTLDGASQIPVGSVTTAFKVGGFVNCTKGSGEDAAVAKNFLSGLSSKQYLYPVSNNFVPTTILITSVGGPDDNYKPLGASGINPIRYKFPGVNNPASYDLWVQLVISGKTNLVCNWSKSVQINTPNP